MASRLAVPTPCCLRRGATPVQCTMPALLLTSQLRILFHRIWNSTSPRRALPSFWRAEGQGGQSSQER